MNFNSKNPVLKVLLLEGVHPSAVNMFDSRFFNVESRKGSLTEDELIEVLPDFHILGIRSKTKLTSKVFKHSEKLMAVGAFCIGTNQVDMDTAMKNGIAVFNSPFSNTRSVAELVIGLSIILLRRIPEKNKAAHEGRWLKESTGCYEARGKTLGIIGYGHIGTQVSVLAESLGYKVIFYDNVPKLSLGNARPASSLKELLSVSDVITLHVPGTPETKNMIAEKEISMMKPGAILLNLSRGDVLKLDAVKVALENNHIGGLAVDVFPSEPKDNKEKFESILQGREDVILTPHIGGSTLEAQEAIGADVAGKLINFATTGSSQGSLTIPELNLPVLNDAHRFLHIHKNVPGVLSEINGVLSDLKANVLGQYLKTNSEIGYVVLDIDAKNGEVVMEKLEKVNNTICSRYLY